MVVARPRARRAGDPLRSMPRLGEVHAAELRRIGSGREAEVFAWGVDRVLRLARTPALRVEFQRECVALDAARRCGALAPMAYERGDVVGRPGLVLVRLDEIGMVPCRERVEISEVAEF